MAAFRATFAARLQAALPPDPPPALEVWAMDERRLGLQTVRRRRLTARGTKPVGLQQQRFENVYLYGAVAPQSGDGYFLGMPKLNASGFQRFVDEFAQARPHTLNILLVDNSRCHHAKAVVAPTNVILLLQEPYAPELNPAARVWQALKAVLAWPRCSDLAARQNRVVEIVRGWQADMLRSLTAYPYIMAAINALSP